MHIKYIIRDIFWSDILFKILSNKCKTLLTAKNKQPDILPAEEYEFLVDNIEGNFDDSLINTAELKEALSKLTPPDAQIIILSIIGGFKSHELAVIYDMPANTIRSRQQRALKQLREITNVSEENRDKSKIFWRKIC